jgi:hypothetical protein
MKLELTIEEVNYILHVLCTTQTINQALALVTKIQKQGQEQEKQINQNN